PEGPGRASGQLQVVPEALLLGAQVAFVLGARGDQAGDLLTDLDPGLAQLGDLVRVVRQQPDAGDAQGAQNGDDRIVFAGIHRQAQVLVRVGGVQPVLLQRVGAQLVQQPDAAALVAAHVDQVPALGGDLRQGGVQLFAAVTAVGAENVPGQAFGV